MMIQKTFNNNREVIMVMDSKEMINNYIDEMVDAKIIALSKSPFAKIDKESIRKECEKKVYNEIDKHVTKEKKILSELPSLLKEDNPHLADQIGSKDKDFLEQIKELGMNWYEKQNFTKAKSYFVFLSKTERENPEFWLLRGMAEHSLHELPEALASYAFALELAPNYSYAHLQLIKCLIAMQELNSAREQFEPFMHDLDEKQKKILESDVNSVKEFLFAKAA